MRDDAETALEDEQSRELERLWGEIDNILPLDIDAEVLVNLMARMGYRYVPGLSAAAEIADEFRECLMTQDYSKTARLN
jgi:hypothetical protein